MYTYELAVNDAGDPEQLIAQTVCAAITFYSIGMIKGLCEENPLVADPHTCQLLYGPALLGKGAGMLIYAVLPSLFLHAGFRRDWLTSLPFWYLAYRLIPTIYGNILALLGM